MQYEVCCVASEWPVSKDRQRSLVITLTLVENDSTEDNGWRSKAIVSAVCMLAWLGYWDWGAACTR